MDLTQGFADVSIYQLILVSAVALFSSVVGGVTGYGNSVLLPLVLVPLIGAEPVVPIVSISGLFNNMTRIVAFRSFTDWKRALIVILGAIVTTALGAFTYTKLTSAGVLVVIGTMLVLSVPLRRLLLHLEIRLRSGGLAVGAAGFGFISGGTTGSGVILLSLLMASGLTGAQVIATDAVISFALSVTKMSVFWASGALTVQVVAFGLLIGMVGIPAAFLARAFVARLPVHVHTSILDAIVVVGGIAMIASAFRQ